MAWSVSTLPKAAKDLQDLVKDAKGRQEFLAHILDEFSGFKADRVTKLFVQGTSSGSVEKLAASRFPGSVRMQIQADYRATLLCLPMLEQAYVVHIFHKSQDPNYKAAVPTHDARVAEFLKTLTDFVQPRK